MPDSFLSPFQNLVSVAEAAQRLKLSPQRVRQMMNEGALEAKKVGHSWVTGAETVARMAPDITSAPIAASTTVKNKDSMKALSFFTGAMGLDIGLEQAGISTIMACETDKWARRTISDNRPDINIIGDIWKYKASEIASIAGLDTNERPDIIAGGPPCQAFSTAGLRKGFSDTRGNVFLYFIDIVTELKPRYLVIENVRGLLSMPISIEQTKSLPNQNASSYSSRYGAIRFISSKLKQAGYQISFNLYNAANFGTPQKRERVILIATTAPNKVPYLQPTHSEQGTHDLPKWRTVREAFSSVDPHNCHHLNFPEKRLKYYRMLSEGQNWRNLPDNVQREAMGKSYELGGGKTGFFRRLAWDKPSPTLVTHPTMPATDLCHPTEDRPLSIEEYRALQEFPDDWSIAGPLPQQYKQLGNAVPISLGRAIGQAIINHRNNRPVPPIEDFKYSRYRNTSDLDILP